MKGRKPLPHAIRIARGTRVKRPIHDQPLPATTAPDCPEHLSGEALKEWHRISQELVELGVVARIDRAALASYCTAYARWVEAEVALKEMGLVVKSPNGYPIANPYLSISNRSLKQIKEFAEQFGMTPSSRTRISTSAGMKSASGGIAKRQRGPA